MRVLYFFDALCGWCYGFSSVMNQLHEEYGSLVPFEVISGGMVLGSQSGPIGKVAGYIHEAHKTVEERTGVIFGEKFLEGTLKQGQVMFDSFPPAKAIRIFKEFKPDHMIQYAADVQSAIYFDGIDPNDCRSYTEMAVNYGVSKRDFNILWNSPDYDVRTREEFLFARQLSITGYPTVFFEVENKYHKIANGYTDFPVLKERLQHVLRISELK